MINIDGKSYYLDLKKISDFVNYSTAHPTKDSEIIDIYETGDDDENNNNGEFNLSTKTVRETTSAGSGQIDNIRYDLVKVLATQILGFGFEEKDDIKSLPFGFEVAFNTLIKEGFLVEIK